MRIFALLTGAVALSVCGFATGSCLVAPPKDINDRGQFLASVIQSLSDFQTAQSSLDEVKTSDGAVAMLSSIDIASENIECVTDEMAGFKASPDLAVKATVIDLQTAAASLSNLNVQLKATFVALLNGSGNLRAGDLAEKLSDLGASYRKTWNLLPHAAEGAFLSLMEYESPTSKKRARLAITTAQRDTLNAELLTAFPKLATMKTTDKATPPEVAAYMLYVGMNKEGMRLHDQPYVARSPAKGPAGRR